MGRNTLINIINPRSGLKYLRLETFKKGLEMYGHMPYTNIKIIKGATIMLEEESRNTDAAGRRKRNRLEARISDKEKQLLKRAAELQGCSLTEFVVRSAQDAARKTLKEHQMMTLSARDTDAFVKALLKPQAPGKRLKQAAERYKKVMGE
jgi:uncharacterized protein (DUF1778 family)